MTPTLRTTRLHLRAPRAGDAEAISTALDNFAVAGNLAQVPLGYSVADAEAWIEANARPLHAGNTKFVISEHGGPLLGVLSFHIDGGEVIVGYWLAETHWGRGLMTEALTAGLSWLFAASDFDCVVSGVFHFNMPSLAIQQKLGFVETGRSMVHCLARNELVEHIDTELTREAFEATNWRAAGLSVKHVH